MTWTASRKAFRVTTPNGALSAWLQRLSAFSPRVDAWATRDVGTCQSAETLVRAMQIMWERDCGCLPVVDEEGRLAGMLTDRDVAVAAFTRGRALGELRVGDTMATLVHTCRMDESVKAALGRMGTHQVRRLPVVDASGRLVGVLSLADVLRRVQGLRADMPLNSAAVVASAWRALWAISQPRT